MKKLIIITIALLIFAGIIYAQAAPARTQTQPQQPVKGFENAVKYVEQEEWEIEIKALIPPTGVFQDKTDTYQKAGEYKFSFTLQDIREQSDKLLNKWLKESK